MKRIRKNATRKIAQVFNQVTECKVYTLDEGFVGRVCDKKYAEKELTRFESNYLRDNEDGSYTVKVHGNLWYNLA